MGAAMCCSRDERSPNERNKNQRVRFFMTGLGSAGKTTVIRQLILLCQERDHYKMCDDKWEEISNKKDEGQEFWLKAIRRNVIDAMDILVKSLKEDGQELPPQLEKITEQLDEIMQQDEDDADEIDVESEQFIEELIQLFNNEKLQEVWRKRNKIRVEGRKLFDGCDHFMNGEKIKSIFQHDYEVTHKDKVHARKPTKDMNIYRFRINDFDIEINDVGGQRSELLKVVDFLNSWSSSTEDSLNYILLVVPVSDFDVEHEEFEDRTLLDESVEYMRLLLNQPVAKNCGLFIFFNKRDRFKEKLQDPECRDSIKYLKEYLKPEDVNNFVQRGKFKEETMRKAVIGKFIEIIRNNQNSEHTSTYRFTCAIDSGMMEGVFGAIRHEVIANRLDTIL